MAVYYIDPVGGSLSNNGSSFALRAKRISQLPALANGDEVRYIESPPPKSLGTGQWTQDSREITFPGGLPVKVIDNCESLWTAAASVTVTRGAGAGVEGTYGASCSLAVAFTTGKIAHFPLPAALDLSAFDAVSFQCGGTLVRHDYINLVLCSDTAGNVPVHTIPLSGTLMETYGAFVPTAAQVDFTPCLWKNGAALSNNINSIALYATTDPGNASPQTILLDNIVAVTEASGVCHGMLVSKDTEDEPYWYHLRSLTPTSVALGPPQANVSTIPTICKPYGGHTEAVETFAQNPYYAPWLAVDRTITIGSGVQPRFTGGWDRTAMATKVGRTFMRQWQAATGLVIMGSATRTVARFDGFTIVGNAGSVVSGTSVTLNQIDDCDFVAFAGNDPYPSDPTLAEDMGDLTVAYFCQSATIVPVMGTSGANNARKVTIGAVISSAATTEAIRCSNNAAVQTAGRPHVPIHVSRIWAPGPTIPAISAQFGVPFMGPTEFRSAPIKARILNTDPTHFIGIPLEPEEVTVANTVRGRLLTEDMMMQRGGYVRRQGVVVNLTPEALMFRVTSADTVGATAARPLAISVAQIAVEAGVPITVKASGRKDNAGLTMQLVIPDRTLGIEGNRIAAVTGVNAWEELSLTVTPVYSGVLEVYGYAWGGTTFTGYLGDFSWEAA